MTASTITLTPEVAAGLDRFIAAQQDNQTRDEMANAILADWLTEEGVLKPVECPPEVAAKGECE